MFNDDRYLERAENIATGLLSYFTPEGFLFGEGGREVGKDGQYPIDLGYNVEESLPFLALYSRLSGNLQLEQTVVRSMKLHLEFMFPDGGWDNSWGTRSFKWTLWGSRTSDGCHASYYAMADKEPVFAEAVYRNLQCLENSTYNHVLYSGPHEATAGVEPSIHHTFNHAKSLSLLLNTQKPRVSKKQDLLPREKVYPIKHFKDINTIER